MSNTLLIYNQLRAVGVSRAGALGLLGRHRGRFSVFHAKTQRTVPRVHVSRTVPCVSQNTENRPLCSYNISHL